MDKLSRLRVKNEATGERLVAQYVREFWECGWQPNESRNDFGIDGQIIMRTKGVDIGVKINVQIKCGAGYISSFGDDEIKLSIHNAQKLENHIAYWNRQLEPAILIFVNPFKLLRDENGKILRDKSNKLQWIENRLDSKAWWVNLKDIDLKPTGTETIIRIFTKNTFGESSKGAFLDLIQPLVVNPNLQTIVLDCSSKNLLNSRDLKTDARNFFLNWKNNQTTASPSIFHQIQITKLAWRHILHQRRKHERQTISLKLLGVAKQIIETVEEKLLLNQKENFSCIEQKYGLRAKYVDLSGEHNVQVVLIRRKSKITNSETWKFYSVHYRR